MTNLGSQPDMNCKGETAQPSISPRPGRTILRLPVTDLAILLVAGSAYVALLTYLGLLRFDDFFTTNWDLGINQQLLWTGAHGRLLYETGDAEFYGLASFLQVHSTYIAFLIAPAYAAAPFPVTLFALQSVIFVASAFPIYLIARDQLKSRTLVFLVIGLYIASFPVLSALLYDFHWEAFMPLEFLSFFYLFRTRRYAWSVVPSVIGILTLEVFPFLVGGVAVLVIYERAMDVGPRWKSLFRDRLVRMSFLLLLSMAVVYVVLRITMFLVIPPLAGAGVTPGLSQGVTKILAVNSTPMSLRLSADYWLLLLAAFAFLPLFAPRYLLLTVPWFTYSVFLTPSFSSGYGNQYALVAVATLAVPLIYGAGRIEQLPFHGRRGIATMGLLLAAGLAVLTAAIFWSRLMLAAPANWLFLLIGLPVAATILVVYFLWHHDRGTVTDRSGPKMARWRASRPRMAAVGVVLVTFVAFNLIMSPLNTENYEATPYPGYWLKYSANPSSQYMEWLVNRIPSDAVVLASDVLFPYVANNPNAWAVPWFPVIPGQPPMKFPFSASNLPRFVLVDSSDWFDLPTSISNLLFNTSTYGIVAFVFSDQYPGTIYLFEAGYTGPSAMRLATAAPTTYYYTATNLSIGVSGQISKDPSGKFGSVVRSVGAPKPSYTPSCIWFGPYVSLLAGSYIVTVNVSGGLLPGGNISNPVLLMNGGPYVGLSVATHFFNLRILASQLNPVGWTALSWQILVSEPYPLVELRGYLAYSGGTPNGEVTLNYIELTRG